MAVVMVVELGESAPQHLPVVVDFGERPFPLERANLHWPISVEVLVVLVLVYQVLAVVDMMGKQGPSTRDTVVRTIR